MGLSLGLSRFDSLFKRESHPIKIESAKRQRHLCCYDSLGLIAKLKVPRQQHLLVSGKLGVSGTC